MKYNHRKGQYPKRATPLPDTASTRYCKWCGKPFPNIQHGRRRWCSAECRYTAGRDTYLQRNYGITLADYLRMWREQNGRCAVCQRKSSITLAVEHSHITGTVRGLCCMACNRDLIHAVDGDIGKVNRLISFFTRMRDDLEAHQVSDLRAQAEAIPGRPVEPVRPLEQDFPF